MKNYIGRIFRNRVEKYEFKAKNKEHAIKVLEELELNEEPTDEFDDDDARVEIEEVEE